MIWMRHLEIFSLLQQLLYIDFKSLNWKYDMDEAFRDFFFLSRSLDQWFIEGGIFWPKPIVSVIQPLASAAEVLC